MNKCKNCAYGQFFFGEVYGSCLLNPPTVVGHGMGYGSYRPNVLRDDVCGQHVHIDTRIRNPHFRRTEPGNA